MFQAGHKLLDTEASWFGVVVGNNSVIGAVVISLPGMEVPSNSVIGAKKEFTTMRKNVVEGYAIQGMTIENTTSAFHSLYDYCKFLARKTDCRQF